MAQRAVLVRAVLVHGFTQTAKSWGPVREHLPPTLQVACPELPGHGSAAGQRLGFVEAAAALGQAGGEGAYVGYSMGARVCLRLALDHPHLVHALVLVGGSPGLVDARHREDRRRDDERLAADLVTLGTAGFVERWLAQPMFETTTPRAEELEARRANPPEGLAHALRALGTGAMEPLWDRLPDLRPPTLLVVGEHDAKFRTIADRMVVAIRERGRGGGGGERGGRAELAVVAGAGHAVPLDQPAACAELIAGFVELHGRSS